MTVKSSFALKKCRKKGMNIPVPLLWQNCITGLIR